MRCGAYGTLAQSAGPATASAAPVDEEEDATPYALSGGPSLQTASDGFVGRIRASKEPAEVTGLAIADKEPRALVGVEESVVILDLQEKSRMGKLNGHEATVTCAAITPDGLKAVSGDEDGHVLVWDVDNRELLASYDVHEGQVASVGLSPCGKFVVSGGEDGAVLLYRAKNGKRLPLKKSRWDSASSQRGVRTGWTTHSGRGREHCRMGGRNRRDSHRFSEFDGGTGGVSFTVDGTHFVAAGAKEVCGAAGCATPHRALPIKH